MTASKPNTLYARKLRAKRKEAGLAEIRGIWAPKQQHSEIKLMAITRFDRAAINKAIGEQK